MSAEMKKPWESEVSDKQKKAGNPNWRPGMKSPNPSGRPRGIVDRRLKLTKMLEGKAEDVLSVVIEAALDRDVHAANLILSRVMPALKSQDERVEFELDTKAPLAEQVEQVLKAMSEGNVSPDTAKQVIDALGVLDAIRAAEDLKQRLDVLEGQ
jgi:hypothetical protein